MQNKISLHHVCIQVSNLKQAEVFYGGFLGLEKLWKFTLAGLEAEKLLGIPLDCQFVKFAMESGVLEIFSASGKPYQATPGMHFCLSVEKRDLLLERLRAADVRIREVSLEGRRVIFIEDPDGNLIEMKESEEHKA